LAVWVQRLRYFISLGVTSQGLCKTDLPVLPPTSLRVLNQRYASLTLLRPPFARAAWGGTGISTGCPSPTPFGLSLGPDLPWADEPSPGNLRLSAGRILTCLFAYSYRHYLFPLLHHPFQDDFVAVGTLPYHRLDVRS
jgi:hypothetical protein